ncbi:MAG: bifunctional diaminohydroxyphosphoribosylaminopyrimidine deaminase/5-amino-6-(5-phosphoribosylamino)uracil reductase RibD [Candidatus Polarisedimenticolaceae bacterium]|nr:bifunctional diaminohydroxyphosphoribosylaminopyrimidine deaminase/5-amino-6-(5-phosphoribosylamino)uracil reductase RibD [Candidatus Polarisedimenticolaceae bacterium]
MSAADDSRFMARAIQLARNGLYTTAPNPRVGCLLVKAGEIIGEGFHYQAGEPHAERIALTEAGAQAKGATAYVTLEPCCHHGRTPPCSDALIEAGVTHVVVGMLDPNPKVAGQGLAQLQKAGIKTKSGLLQAEAEQLNPGFIKRMTSGLPFVRCKLAMSLDGRTAMADGESKWITSNAARLDVQQLRAKSSAIITGIETVLNDDPSMNVRIAAEALRGVVTEQDIIQPLRVVMDSNLRTPPTAKMLSLPGETVIAYTNGDATAIAKLESAGATLIQLPGPAGQVEAKKVLRYLAEREINEVLIEAGPTLAGRFLAAGLIDELVIYMAFHLMGDGSRGLFNLPGLEQMSQRINLEVSDMRRLGPDLRITATLKPPI